METVKEILKIRDPPTQTFKNPDRQSIEQTENYAFKQVVHTKELIVDGVPYAPGGGLHAPTNYVGTDFVGVNPNKTLTHIRDLAVGTILIIGGRIMHRTLEYTIAGAVITMVDVYIEDTDYVMVCD